MINLGIVEEFFVDSPFEDPDQVTVSLIGRNGEGDKAVIKFTLAGDVHYPSTIDPLTMPQSQDFLEQFAACLGYVIGKEVVDVLK